MLEAARDVAGLAHIAEPGPHAEAVRGGGEEPDGAAAAGIEPGERLHARGEGLCGGDRGD